MAPCPSCHYLVADGDAGCAFCGRPVDRPVDHYDAGTPPRYDGGTTQLATAPVTAAAVETLDFEPIAMTVLLRSPDDPEGVAHHVAVGAGVTFWSGPSNMVIAVCLLVGIALFAFGLMLFTTVV